MKASEGEDVDTLKKDFYSVYKSLVSRSRVCQCLCVLSSLYIMLSLCINNSHVSCKSLVYFVPWFMEIPQYIMGIIASGGWGCVLAQWGVL